MSLVAPRRPHRATDLIAGTQLAAPDLRGRDVRLVTASTHEAAAVGQDVEHAGDETLVLGGRLVFGRGLFGGVLLHGRLVLNGLLVAVRLPLGAAPTSTAAPATARALRRRFLVGLVVGVGLDGGRLLVRDRLLDRRRTVAVRLAALRAQDRVDQLRLAQAAVSLEAQLRRDRVEVRERAAFEFLALEDGHGGRQP